MRATLPLEFSRDRDSWHNPRNRTSGTEAVMSRQLRAQNVVQIVPVLGGAINDDFYCLRNGDCAMILSSSLRPR